MNGGLFNIRSRGGRAYNPECDDHFREENPPEEEEAAKEEAWRLHPLYRPGMIPSRHLFTDGFDAGVAFAKTKEK